MATSPDRIAEILGHAEQFGFEEACRKYKITHETLRRYRNEIKTGTVNRTVTENEQQIMLYSWEVKTLDDLIEFCEIDTTVWEPYKFIANTWGSPTNPCTQAKAWFRKIVPVFDIATMREQFIEDAKKHAPEYKTVKRVHKPETGNMLEISLIDFHLGLLAWKLETLDANYDLKIARGLYLEAVNHFLEVAMPYSVERILFPIGSDWFNVNSAQNATAKGIVQDEDGRWKKTFTIGRQLAVEAIDLCRGVADVDVLVIPGNHDFERSFYLGDSLSCWYNRDGNVTVDNGPQTRKYRLWGKTLLGFTHGSEEKLQTLPTTMAVEARDLWGKASFWEWHIGHLHNQKAYAWQPIAEENGVRVRIIPSLVAASAWSSKAGYHAVREGQAFIFNRDRGNVAVYHYRPGVA